jgi:hypothetical protein
MKIRTSLLICVCLATLTQAMWSQNQKTDHSTTPGILGFLDPKTGAFRPVPQNQDVDEAAPAVTRTTGKFVFNFNITIRSTNLGSDTIACYATVNVADNVTGSYTVFLDEASVSATVTGSTAKCTVSIPYSWPLVTPTSDSVSMSWYINANGPASTGGQPSRISQESLPSIKVPLNGATTTNNIAATI